MSPKSTSFAPKKRAASRHSPLKLRSTAAPDIKDVNQVYGCLKSIGCDFWTYNRSSQRRHSAVCGGRKKPNSTIASHASTSTDVIDAPGTSIDTIQNDAPTPSDGQEDGPTAAIPREAQDEGIQNDAPTVLPREPSITGGGLDIYRCLFCSFWCFPHECVTSHWCTKFGGRIRQHNGMPRVPRIFVGPLRCQKCRFWCSLTTSDPWHWCHVTGKKG